MKVESEANTSVIERLSTVFSPQPPDRFGQGSQPVIVNPDYMKPKHQKQMTTGTSSELNRPPYEEVEVSRDRSGLPHRCRRFDR
jgi:hypothetical protein